MMAPTRQTCVTVGAISALTSLVILPISTFCLIALSAPDTLPISHYTEILRKKRRHRSAAFLFSNMEGSDYSETAPSTSSVTPGPMVEDRTIFFM